MFLIVLVLFTFHYTSPLCWGFHSYLVRGDSHSRFVDPYVGKFHNCQSGRDIGRGQSKENETFIIVENCKSKRISQRRTSIYVRIMLKKKDNHREKSFLSWIQVVYLCGTRPSMSVHALRSSAFATEPKMSLTRWEQARSKLYVMQRRKLRPV